MNDPVAQIDAYVAALHAAGVRAAVDISDINPPAVQMRVPTLTFRFGRGCVQADWVARLMMPDNGQRNAFVAAMPIITQIQDALEGVAVTATPQDFAMPDGAIIPGFELTWSTR